VREPHLLGLDLGPHAPFRGLDGGLPSPVFGWVVLAVTVAMCLLVAAIRRSGIGMQMLAVRSNERAAAAAGTDVRAVKLTAFAISAFIAGVAGTLYAYNFGSVSDARFDALTALSLIAFAYAGGVTLVSGALFAGLVSTEALLPHAFDKWLGISGNWFLLFGGVILIFTLIQHPEGIAGALNKRLRQRKGPKLPSRTAPSLGAQPGRPSPAVGER
jgi:branched-chain amino acid transport system permease protein